MRATTEGIHTHPDYPNYYKLTPGKRPLWYWIFWPFIQAFELVKNVISLTLGRLLALVIFNPLLPNKPEGDVSRHKQNQKFPDPEHIEDFVVISATRKPGFFLKSLQNIAHKLYEKNPHAPEFIRNGLSKLLNFNVVKEEDCERLIGKVIKIAQEAKQKNQPIHPENIHIKGLEYVEPKLRAQTLKTINDTLSAYFDDPDYKIENNRKKINFFSLETSDNAVLDSAEIYGKGESAKPISERTFTIFCMPRSNHYMLWLKKLQSYAHFNQTTYIGFNYRGVERSQGIVWSQQDMIQDTLEQARRLILMGAKPENITFEGECIGGAIATLAAARMHEEGHPVRLFNCRSFRFVASLIAGKVIPPSNASFFNPINYLRGLFGAILYIVTPILLWITNWDLDAGSAWSKIPKYDAQGRVIKDYLCVKSPNREQYKDNLDDPVIDHQTASIHSKVIEDLLDRGVPLNRKERREVQSHTFMVNPESGGDPKKRNGHVCGLNQLMASNLRKSKQTQKPLTAREYQGLFYQRARLHKPVKEHRPEVRPSASAA